MMQIKHTFVNPESFPRGSKKGVVNEHCEHHNISKTNDNVKNEMDDLI